jgi:starch synthase
MPYNVCQVAAELTPFAKTGGLGDVAAGLSRYLGRTGHDVRIFLPFYAQIARRSETFVPVDFIQSVPLWMGDRLFHFSLRTAKLPASDVDVYFIDCGELFGDLLGNKGIYHGDQADGTRFAFLTRAAFESCQRMGWSPHVVHCHDWHTALAPVYLKTLYSWDSLFHRTRTVLTLHNMGFQGLVDAGSLHRLGLAEHAGWLDRTDLGAGRINFLKTGLMHADFITAVSRTYAKEIQTAEDGFGLDWLVRARADRLRGIVNGVDYGEWDPAADPNIPHHYAAADLAGKREMKQALLQGVGMDATDAPVIGIVSRLTPQKGFDLCFDVLPDLLSRRDCRLVALGSGEDKYEQFFNELSWRFRGRAWYYRGYNEPLSHWIEAGADLFLMPSLFEPCGLNQMYSLRYGTPPVVRRTGGLADTVQLFDSATGEGTGFVFDHFHAAGLRWALDYALDTYPHRETWEKLMRNGMAQDFSWDVQGQEYVEVYEGLVG